MSDKINTLEEISKFIFTSKYARYNDKLKRRETWEEAVSRVEEMHLKRYAFLSKSDKEKIKWAFDLVREKRVVPSMRSMQFGGAAIEAKNERMYNCCVKHVDSIRSFAELFFLLLCGCGTGIGLSKQFLGRLPDIVDENDKSGIVLTYAIEDTIEGWADSVEALLNCYFKNTAYTGRKVVFDYSKIRKKGTLLKTGGGKAPGHLGLKQAHQRIKALFDYIIEEKHQSRLKSINAYDILMHCADAVLSGGIRRAATAVVFQKDDEDMISAKTFSKVDKVFAFTKEENKHEGKVLVEGKKYEVCLSDWELKELQEKKIISWFHTNPQRARSNNSILLFRGETSLEEFKDIIAKTKEFGEPGFVFSNEKNALYNPCFEIGFLPVTDDGQCGVQFCNLTSINGRLSSSLDLFLEHVEAATIIGTLQAGYFNFPYLSNVATKLTKEESLLGVSITGCLDNPDVLLDAQNQKAGSELSKAINEEWAKKIGINPAARITCVKPEGTTSLVLSTGSGIHPHHARRYFRRVQNNKLDNVYKFFKKNNPKLCEPSVWSANHTDDIVIFPIEIDEKAIVKKDLNAIKHLETIKSTQQNWVLNGTSKHNKKNIDHNVSCTVIVKNDEWEQVINYIFDNQEFFAAVSLLPASGDKDYPQAPMEEIQAADEEKWNEILSNFKSVDYTELTEDDDKTHLVEAAACAGGACDTNI